MAIMVGVPGFEPGTSSSRTMRATRLRYTPPSCCTRHCLQRSPIVYHHPRVRAMPRAARSATEAHNDRPHPAQVGKLGAYPSPSRASFSETSPVRRRPPCRYLTVTGSVGTLEEQTSPSARPAPRPERRQTVHDRLHLVAGGQLGRRTPLQSVGLVVDYAPALVRLAADQVHDAGDHDLALGEEERRLPLDRREPPARRRAATPRRPWRARRPCRRLPATDGPRSEHATPAAPRSNSSPVGGPSSTGILSSKRVHEQPDVPARVPLVVVEQGVSAEQPSRLRPRPRPLRPAGSRPNMRSR